MCWKCDHPEATFEDWRQEIRAAVDRRGWVIQYIEDEDAPFAYTIGLHPLGLPELLVTGLDPKPTVTLMNRMIDLVGRGKLPDAGQQLVLPNGPRIEIVDVEHPDAHMGMAIALEGPRISAKQVVWADEFGHWPWSAKFNHARRRQPVLGVRGG